MNFQNLFFSPHGRIGRQEFWVGWAVLFAAGIVIWLVSLLIPLLNVLFSLAVIYPLTCVYVKRYHDLGVSGWWRAVPYVVWVLAVIVLIATAGAAFINLAMSGKAEDPAALAPVLASAGIGLLFIGVACLVSLVMWLWAGIAPSQPAENRFGPLPGAEITLETFS